MRDARGRFAPGNDLASAGGRARAAKLSRRRRRQIARMGYRAMVEKHFLGDFHAQHRYLGELGAYAYDVQAGAHLPGSPLRPIARHPGTISEWLCRYWQLELFAGVHLDVNFPNAKELAR